MLEVFFDAEGLDVAQHCGQCLHIGEHVSCFNFKLLDLAASVDVVRVLGPRSGHGDSRRPDLFPLALFIVVGVEKSCGLKVRNYPQQNEHEVIYT